MAPKPTQPHQTQRVLLCSRCSEPICGNLVLQHGWKDNDSVEELPSPDSHLTIRLSGTCTSMVSVPMGSPPSPSSEALGVRSCLKVRSVGLVHQSNNPRHRFTHLNKAESDNPDTDSHSLTMPRATTHGTDLHTQIRPETTTQDTDSHTFKKSRKRQPTERTYTPI